MKKPPESVTAVIITDEFDPLIFQAFRDQPPEASPIRAFRTAITTVFSQVSPDDFQASPACSATRGPAGSPPCIPHP